MALNVCDIPLNDVYFVRALYEYKTDNKTILDSNLSTFLNNL